MKKLIFLVAMLLMLVLVAGCAGDEYSPSWSVSLSLEHSEIHDGHHFYLSGFETENAGANVTFAVTTPNTTTWAHMTFSVSSTSQSEVYIYEGSTVAGGTVYTPINNNRNSAQSSVLTIVKDPVVNANGTLLYSQSSGLAVVPPNAADVYGLHERDKEIILRQNTTYIFVFVSRDANNIISYLGEWYEHVLR